MHQEMYVKAFSLYLLTWITAVYGAYYLPLSGNVYPAGHYTVTMNIGNPPKPFVLDVDTGSDLTWIQCFQQPSNPYDFRNEAVASCADSDCISLGNRRDHYTYICESPDVPCQYSFNYDDGSLCEGILISDSFPLTYNGETIYPTLSFGCGDPIQYAHPIYGLSPTVGVLGLGKGESGILKQLSNMGVTRNVVGQCLSGQGGGYISFDEVPAVPASIVWKHISNDHSYILGIADILFGGQTTNIGAGYATQFDSGSTYTYLASKAYRAIFYLINNNLNGRLSVAVGDNTLPVCWQDVRPIETISQVESYFLPLTLSFVDAENVGFEIPTQNYLIISDKNNVCLGIMEHPNNELRDTSRHTIGAISMQDKLVIYDNDNGRVGWAAVPTCNIYDP